MCTVQVCRAVPCVCVCTMHTRRTTAGVHGANTEDHNFRGMYRNVGHMYMHMYKVYVHMRICTDTCTYPPHCSRSAAALNPQPLTTLNSKLAIMASATERLN